MGTYLVTAFYAYLFAVYVLSAYLTLRLSLGMSLVRSILLTLVILATINLIVLAGCQWSGSLAGIPSFLLFTGLLNGVAVAGVVLGAMYRLFHREGT